jgi:hypothetical protein
VNAAPSKPTMLRELYLSVIIPLSSRETIFG